MYTLSIKKTDQDICTNPHVRFYDDITKVAVVFKHSWKLPGSKRPGTVCRVFLLPKDAKRVRLEACELLDTETIYLHGKFQNKYNYRTGTMRRVWVGDNFCRSIARSISLGLILKRLGLSKIARTALLRQVR